MENIIIVVSLIMLLGSAGYYIYHKKKSGSKCIGCPYSKSCSSCCNSKK